MKQYQVYSRMLKMPIEQSTIYEENKRTSPIGNALRTMAGNLTL